MTTPEFAALLVRHGFVHSARPGASIFEPNIKAAAQELREQIAVERQQMLDDFAKFAVPTCDCHRCKEIPKLIEKWKA